MKIMRMQIKIAALAFAIVQPAYSQELVSYGQLFGEGLHLNWEPILNNGVRENTVISNLSTTEWKYEATYTPDKHLNISRINIQGGQSEPLINFNSVLPVEGMKRPARIVDVFEEANSIAFLLAVTDGYVYAKIVNNIDTVVGNDNLILPPKGVGQGVWRIIKKSFSPTTFGYHLPEISPAFSLISLEFSSLTEVSVIVKGELKPLIFNFSGDVITKNSVPIEVDSDDGVILNPSVYTVDEVVEEIQGIADPVPNAYKDLYKLTVESNEGGQAYYIGELNSKLTGHPAELKKIQAIHTEVFPPK